MSVQTIDGEPAVVAVGDLLDEGDARALTARIRTQLEHLDELLLAAWRGRIWTALGHPTWDAWVAAELGTVRLRLPVKQRRAVAAAWRAEGMSQRAIATGLGVSKGTVATDLADAPAGEGLAVVVSLDGRRRPAVAPASPSPVPRRTKTATALESLREAGPVGLTWFELGRRHRWHHGQSSSTLTALHRQGRIVLSGERRGRSGVYLHRDHAETASSPGR